MVECVSCDIEPQGHVFQCESCDHCFCPRHKDLHARENATEGFTRIEKEPKSPLISRETKITIAPFFLGGFLDQLLFGFLGIFYMLGILSMAILYVHFRRKNNNPLIGLK